MRPRPCVLIRSSLAALCLVTLSAAARANADDAFANGGSNAGSNGGSNGASNGAPADPNHTYRRRPGKCTDCSRCQCEEAPPARAFDEKTGIGGLRVSFSRVSGTPSDGSGVSLTFAGNAEDYTTGAQVSTRSSVFWAIGGGSQNFEGALGAKLTGGWRIPLDLHQGPVIRLGFGGYLQGNSLLYTSMLQLPVLEVGYQYQLGYTLFEIGVDVSPVLAGRYDPGDSSRRLGRNFESSVYGAIHFAHVRFDGSLQRIFGSASGNGTPVDVARATLCTYPAPVGVCADLWAYRGDVLGATGWATARSGVLGLSIGYSTR